MDELTESSEIFKEFNSRFKDQRQINRIWDRIEKIIKDVMNEVIPSKKTCKSDVSNRPKLSSDTYKLNKWLIRIVKVAKKNRYTK